MKSSTQVKLIKVAGHVRREAFVIRVVEFTAIETLKVYSFHDGFSNKKLKKDAMLRTETYQRNCVDGSRNDGFSFFTYCHPWDTNTAIEKIKEQLMSIAMEVKLSIRDISERIEVGPEIVHLVFDPKSFEGRLTL